jgi:hypothetical protein
MTNLALDRKKPGPVALLNGNITEPVEDHMKESGKASKSERTARARNVSGEREHEARGHRSTAAANRSATKTKARQKRADAMSRSGGGRKSGGTNPRRIKS